MTTVRRVRRGDLTALIGLAAKHAQFERAPFVTAGKSNRLRAAIFSKAPRLHSWVAEANGHVVGYATATEDYSTWSAAAFLHMDCLFVLPKHRNKGLGALLLDVVIRHARRRGIDQVQWQTPVWNKKAARFYRRFGATDQQKVRFRLALR